MIPTHHCILQQGYLSSQVIIVVLFYTFNPTKHVYFVYSMFYFRYEILFQELLMFYEAQVKFKRKYSDY